MDVEIISDEARLIIVVQRVLVAELNERAVVLRKAASIMFRVPTSSKCLWRRTFTASPKGSLDFNSTNPHLEPQDHSKIESNGIEAYLQHTK